MSVAISLSRSTMIVLNVQYSIPAKNLLVSLNIQLDFRYDVRAIEGLPQHFDGT